MIPHFIDGDTIKGIRLVLEHTFLGLNWTYPVEVETAALKSLVQYNMATISAREVTKPMNTVLMRARGTTVAAFWHSSARCNAPSMPAYI